jgi:hypothetical protein
MARSSTRVVRALGSAVLAASAAAGTYLLVRARRRELAAAGSALGHGLLLDEFLPQYEFRGVASVSIRATPDQIFRALQEVSLADMPLADFMIKIRYLPGRLLGHEVLDSASVTTPISEQLDLGNNIVLAEAPQRELVIGAVGQFHNMFDQQPVQLHGPEEFLTFSDPAHQKLVMSWYLASGDESTGYRLVMENRTHALSEEAKRKFIPYWWLLIKWGSEVMSRILLAAIKRRAEANVPGGSTPETAPGAPATGR